MKPASCAARLLVGSVLFATLAVSQEPKPQLNLTALAEPIKNLTPQDRQVFDQAIKQIDQDQHLEALTTLTRLSHTDNNNPALRIARAYALLELGKIAAALDDAKVAESSGTHTPYKCWFLAQVAYLAGNKPLCHREIGHIGANPTYGPGAQKLGQALNNARR
jgi:predicted Zn-dependent protease